MRLGIVGHGWEKFTPETTLECREQMENLIVEFSPTVILSGRSPMGGVDIWAEDLATKHGIEMDIKVPKTRSWDGDYGYKARNLDIAACSDVVVCVVVRVLPPGFKGMTFNGCYHCKGRNPVHVKSGGCWTAWKAPKQEWRIIG